MHLRDGRRQFFQRRSQPGLFRLHGNEPAGQVASLRHRFAQTSSPVRRRAALPRSDFFSTVAIERGGRASQGGLGLAKSIVQIATDAALFAFADLDDLMLQPARMFQQSDAAGRGIVLAFQGGRAMATKMKKAMRTNVSHISSRLLR